VKGAKPPPPPKPQPPPAQQDSDGYERRDGTYLGGYAAGDGRSRSLDAAKERCDQLGGSCGGVTCRSERSCTVRASKDPRRSPSGEFSYVKGAKPPPPPPPAQQNSDGYERRDGTYLGGYAAGDGRPRPLDSAKERCDQLGGSCGGVTCRSDSSCTVRASKDPRRSPSGEFSYVKGDSEPDKDADEYYSYYYSYY